MREEDEARRLRGKRHEKESDKEERVFGGGSSDRKW